MNAVRQLLTRIRREGVRRKNLVSTISMGCERQFEAWDLGEDTIILEQGIFNHLRERPSVLIVEKSSLDRKQTGRVMTISTGNHSVAALPLLDGRFWKLSRLPHARRGEVLMREILPANVVDGGIELSQREVPTRVLFAVDEWLRQRLGLTMADVVFAERNDNTLEHCRARGEDWRVKPLAWSEVDMKTALAASRKRIGASIVYYHSARGVHFLTVPEFRRLTERARTDPEQFVLDLKELVGLYEGSRLSFMRQPKYRGHHEIELFGVQRGLALERLVPELEKLLEAIALARIGQLGVIQRAEELAELFEWLLTDAQLADESSGAFVETMYMHLTGEVYAVSGEGKIGAFGDYRTALPGATFVNGEPMFHPGTDERSEVLLINLRALLSKDEKIEYANVYELHDRTDNIVVGKGPTREVVYKTNRRPLETSLVEKRLSRSGRDYGSYMLSRVEAFKALGVALSEYRVLRRSRAGSRPVDFYIRRRCEGEPIDLIPANYFTSADDSSVEEKEVVLGVCTLMGDAAAQNFAMKKYDPQTHSPIFGIGKEIYEFEYDLVRGRVSPKKVSTCSIRGTMGWPSLERTDENLAAMADFYLKSYAQALMRFCGQHHSVMIDEAGKAFCDGFEYRTRAMGWQLSVMRDKFESFSPRLAESYEFVRKWRFALWALERQERRVDGLRRQFMALVATTS